MNVHSLKNLLLVWCFLGTSLFVSAQNCPLTAPLDIIAGSTQIYTFEVFDLVQDNLADANQAVCSIDISFVHNHIGNFELQLISPGLDTVNLIGPNVSTSQLSLGFQWEMQFVNDSIDPAVPDFPFGDRFDNSINDFALNAVTFPLVGQYFPYQGSLSDFNSGSVNGTWQLVAKTDPTSTLFNGEISNFKINFCDPTGENCCFADAGSFANTDSLEACAGDLSLDFIPQPVYSGTAPDTSLYGYTYLIGENGLLQAYDSLPNFSLFTPGLYQLCGLSYRKDQRDSFPIPDGMLSLDSIRNNLDGPFPWFCGQVTDTCIQIRILDLPSPTDLGVQNLCDQDSLQVGDSILVASGIYTIAIPMANRCDSIVSVEIVIGNSVRDTIQESACRGESFTSATGVVLDTTGFYTFSYPTASGCDSVVVVDFTRVEILPSILPSALDFTCQDTLIRLDAITNVPFAELNFRWEAPPFGAIISTDTFATITEPGRYTLQISLKNNPLGCFAEQSSFLIGTNLLAPLADAGIPDTLDCSQDTLRLDASNTNGANPFSFEWLDPNGILINDTTATPLINEAGIYTLIAMDQLTACRDTSTVSIGLDTIAPILFLPQDTVLGCAAGVRVEVVAEPSNRPYAYTWRSASGGAVQDGNTDAAFLTFIDDFTVNVQDLQNSCTAEASLRLRSDTSAPQIQLATPTLLNCQVTEIMLDARGSDTGPNIQVSWQSLNGNFLSGTNSLEPLVNRAGTYSLTLLDISTACQTQASVEVKDTSYSLTARINQFGILSCGLPEIELTTEGSTTGPNIIYLWSDLDNGTFGGLLSDRVQVSRGGVYQLLVQDTFTKCLEPLNISIIPDTTLPKAIAGPDLEINCNNPIVTLSAMGSDSLVQFAYRWTGPCIIDADSLKEVDVSCEGIYVLEVRNTISGCVSTDTVLVSLNPTVPMAIIADSLAVDCSTGLALLDASSSSGGAIEWFFEGNPLGSNADTLTVNQPGVYTLRVNNAALMCMDEKEVVVSLDCQPMIQLSLPDTITCRNPVIALNASNSTGENLVFQWSGPEPGCFGIDSTSADVSVSCPGVYELILRNELVDQADTLRLEIFDNIQLPMANAGGDFTLTCDPAFRTVLGSSDLPFGAPSFSWMNDIGDTLSNASNLDVSQAGSYILTVVDQRNACFSKDTLEVFAPVIPDFQINQPEIITCATPSVNLSAQVFSNSTNLDFNWTALEGQVISSNNSNSLNVESPGAYQLSLRDTLAGCFSRDTIRVLEDINIPLAEAGVDQVQGCGQDTVFLSTNGSASGSQFAYLWIPSVPSSLIDGQDSTIALVRDTGLYKLFVLDTGTGCIGEDSTSVLSPSPLPAIPSPAQQVLDCAQTSIELNTGLGNTPDYGQRWIGNDDLGLNIIDTITDQLLVTQAGTYQLFLEDLATNCQDTSTFVIGVDQVQPQFLIEGDSLLNCRDTLLEMTINTAFDTTLFDLIWSNPTVLLERDSNTIRIKEPGMLVLRIENLQNACVGLDSIEVLQNIEQPTFLLDGPALMDCLQDTLQLDASFSAGDFSLNWSGAAQAIVGSSNQASVQVVAPGSFQFALQDNENGCIQVDSILVADGRIAPTLGVDTSNLLISCTDPVLLLDASTSLTVSGKEPLFDWDGPGVISKEALVAVNQGMILNLSLSDPENGCSQVYPLEITADTEKPQIQLSKQGELGCATNGVALFAQISNLEPSFTINWAGPEGQTFSVDTMILVNEAGLYTLRVENPVNGCVSEQSTEIVTSTAIPQVTILDAGDLDCFRDDLSIEVSSRNYDLSALNFSWTTVDGSILEGGDTPNLMVNEAGTYQLRVLHEPTMCFVVDSVSVARTGRRIRGFTASFDPEECNALGGGLILTNEVFGGDAPFVFSLGGADFVQSSNFKVPKAGNYLLGIEDLNGCKYDSIIQVEPGFFPVPDLGEDLVITLGDSIALNASVGPAPFSEISWITNNTIVSTRDTSLVVKPTRTSAYTVTTQDADGCIFTDQISVFVQEGNLVYLPGAFSPDEDGINDVFVPGFSNQVNNVTSFQVFNRWGQLLFERNNINPASQELGWNGLYQGELQSTGVYIFVLALKLENGEDVVKSGEVLLLR